MALKTKKHRYRVLVVLSRMGIPASPDKANNIVLLIYKGVFCNISINEVVTYIVRT